MQIDVKKIVSLIDLTSLNDSDTASSIEILCNKAFIHDTYVAAVCVYPHFVKQVAQFFSGSPVKIATVANFPHGTDSLVVVEKVIEKSIADGAQEIDVVFPYQQYLSGEKSGAYDFVRACKKHCGKTVLLKVILETGVLQDRSLIAEVSRGVVLAGADFLKTSTGKVPVGATSDAVMTMLNVIKDMSHEVSHPVGLKVSAGVRTVEHALHFINIAEQIMGVDWVNPASFRLGASQLIDQL